MAVQTWPPTAWGTVAGGLFAGLSFFVGKDSEPHRSLKPGPSAVRGSCSGWRPLRPGAMLSASPAQLVAGEEEGGLVQFLGLVGTIVTLTFTWIRSCFKEL